MTKDQDWDYYDKSIRSYIYLDCRLKQKYYSQSVREAEDEEQYQTGMLSSMREHGDLQLHDTDGIWFTRSEDPEFYLWPTFPSEDADSLDERVVPSDVRTCNLCDLICQIRDDNRYLLDDGSCPYADAVSKPQLIYLKVQDYDRPCQDFLHPLLLQDIKTINKRRARIAKARIWKHLQEPRWMHTLINSGQRISDVWKRNYTPVTFYFNSFASVWLYIKNLPPDVKHNRHLLRRVRENLELSPSFHACLRQGAWEHRMLKNIDSHIEEM